MLEHSSIYGKIINAVLADYREIFFVDLETNGYVYFSNIESRKDAREESDFFKGCAADAQKYIHEEDRPAFIDRLSKERLLENIGYSNIDLLEYRSYTGEDINWYCIRLIKGKYSGSDKYVILGVKEITDLRLLSNEAEAMEVEQAKLNQIADALANTYDSLYYINLETNGFIEFSSSARYKKNQNNGQWL